MSSRGISYEPEPIHVLFGCLPFVPFRGYAPDARGNDPPFHAPEGPVPPASPWSRERCPVCKGRRDHPRVHCAWCALGERARRQIERIVEARNESDQRLARAQSYTDEKQGVDRKTRRPKRPLTEAQRRHVATTYGAEGLRWLRALGQLPDWSLTLDRRGRPVSLEDLDGDLADGQQARRLDQRSDDD